MMSLSWLDCLRMWWLSFSIEWILGRKWWWLTTTVTFELRDFRVGVLKTIWMTSGCLSVCTYVSMSRSGMRLHHMQPIIDANGRLHHHHVPLTNPITSHAANHRRKWEIASSPRASVGLLPSAMLLQHRLQPLRNVAFAAFPATGCLDLSSPRM